MATVQELLGLIGTEGAPETIYDDIASTYATESAGWQSGQDEMAAENAALKEEILRLKSVNYDLLIAAGTGEVAPDETTGETPDETTGETPDDNAEDADYDDLFGNKE